MDDRLQFDAEKNKNLPHFTIKGTMPSLNEYLADCRRHPQIGAKTKRQYAMLASYAIRYGLKKWQAKRPVIIHFRYFEPNKKRDKDNIHGFCCKAVMDALQDCKVIKNDGWADIENYTHDYFVDKKNPRIEVYIEEVE